MAKADERASQVTKRSRAFIRACRRLGLRVRALRLRKRMTLEAAAESMDMDLKHLQKVEAGKVNVTMVTLVRIASGLDVSLGDLCPRDARAAPEPPPSWRTPRIARECAGVFDEAEEATATGSAGTALVHA